MSLDRYLTRKHECSKAENMFHFSCRPKLKEYIWSHRWIHLLIVIMLSKLKYRAHEATQSLLQKQHLVNYSNRVIGLMVPVNVHISSIWTTWIKLPCRVCQNICGYILGLGQHGYMLWTLMSVDILPERSKRHIFNNIFVSTNLSQWWTLKDSH